MNEDDTYNKLRRPSLAEMERLYQHWKAYHVVTCSTENIEFANKHGWGWLEFLQARHNSRYPMSG